MIDLKQEMQDFGVINLKDISQNEAGIPDNVRNSVFLYNKAIESLRTGSEDIAIIELKKAISMNPHFYEAMNLLGICYGYTKDNAHAEEIFDRVVKAEKNSVKALRYLSLLNGGEVDGSIKSRAKKRNTVPVTKDIKSKRDKLDGRNGKSFTWVRYAVFFSAGILLALLIQTIFFKPEKIEGSPADNNIISNGKISDEYKTKYEQLLSKNELLQRDLDEANKSLDYSKSVMKLYEIESFVSKKQMENAADMLLLMNTTDFQGEDRARFDNLYKSVMPSAAWTVYNEGYKLYNTKKYQESLKKLSKVELYDPLFSRMDAVLYYSGRCYQLLDDSRNAVALFQKLIDSYPKSNYSTNAKVRIKAMTQIP
ncbi:MAG: tetratricopeptide repeat protein [Ruminiclostridium sp.]|nr:tetratricopeptide repeat protein [Ruminiclostridium sp.]